MTIRKISKCYTDAKQYIVLGLCNAIVAVFFVDSLHRVYRVHYLTQSPSEQREIMEAINHGHF